jgi:hypothetical protein
MWATRRLIRREAGLDPRRDGLSKGVATVCDPSTRRERVGWRGAGSCTVVHARHRPPPSPARPRDPRGSGVGRVVPARSQPTPAGDDDGRGRRCTTLRDQQVDRPRKVDGSHTVAHPLGQPVAAIVAPGSSGIMATRCPHRPRRYDDDPIFNEYYRQEHGLRVRSVVIRMWHGGLDVSR